MEIIAFSYLTKIRIIVTFQFRITFRTSFPLILHTLFLIALHDRFLNSNGISSFIIVASLLFNIFLFRIHSAHLERRKLVWSFVHGLAEREDKKFDFMKHLRVR